MSQQANGIGIAFEVDKVLPAATFFQDLIFPLPAIPLSEVRTNGSFSTMSKGWLPQVVC